jgi:phosphinothricin acetyltransferase
MEDAMKAYSMEPLCEQHRNAVVELFNHYVQNGFSAYFDKPLPPQFFDRLLQMASGYPSVAVLDESGSVAGFGLLHAFHPAPAFSATAEASYFLSPGHTGRGVGALVLERLIGEAGGLGIRHIVASVSSLNAGSIAFHLKNGFREAGRLESVGRKFDRDFDVIWFQRDI